MSVQKYRKRPVVIEAMQFDGTIVTANLVLAWIGGHGHKAEWANAKDPGEGLIITTLEGDMYCPPWYYVIRGVKGEFYSCDPDIFAQTYETVEEQS